MKSAFKGGPTHALVMLEVAVSQDKKQAEFSDLCQSVQLNAGDRIDWSLQEDLSIMTVAGVAGELWLGSTLADKGLRWN